MKSIQRKLASGLLISLMTVFLLLWLIVSQNIQKLSEDNMTSRLKHDIETLLTAVSFDQNDNIKIDEEYINSVYKRPFSGHYYLIQFRQTNIRSRSLWDQSLIAPSQLNSDYQTSYQPGPDNQALIVLSAQFEKQKHMITISIAEDLTPVTQAIDSFENYFTIISISMLAGLLLIQVIILKRGLQPLRKIHSELSQLEQGKITSLSVSVPYELKAVVKEINQLSLALNKRLQRSRDALSDLSHAIKKPLTVLQQLSDQETTLNKTSKVTLDGQIDSIQKITDRILKRARVAGKSRTTQSYSISQELDLLIKTIRMMYPDKDLDTELNLTDKLQINIDREDLLELLGNLLDNAWKWADKKILISIRQDQQLHISIEDDGSGHKAESLNEVMNRGVRLDESVSGYGFGLAISAGIVKDYEGTLHFSRSETLGGFKAEISIPA
ncbi:MAG: HAMP domain-containing histidine kinase [Gammaproteobacteria bacterium]|nr:HAMP domain-containing histidine kinase [Gammaproteobacteria bacterium]